MTHFHFTVNVSVWSYQSEYDWNHRQPERLNYKQYFVPCLQRTSFKCIRHKSADCLFCLDLHLSNNKLKGWRSGEVNLVDVEWQVTDSPQRHCWSCSPYTLACNWLSSANHLTHQTTHSWPDVVQNTYPNYFPEKRRQKLGFTEWTLVASNNIWNRWTLQLSIKWDAQVFKFKLVYSASTQVPC